MIDGQKRERWTPEDLQFLQDKWGKIPIVAIADHLHRARTAVETKAHALGLGSGRVNRDAAASAVQSHAQDELPAKQPHPWRADGRPPRRASVPADPSGAQAPRGLRPESDLELSVMREILILLERLDVNARLRALEWVYARLNMAHVQANGAV